MFRKSLLSTLALFSILCLNVQAEWRGSITMLAVPRDMQAIQIAQDISRRYGVLLVCYQQVSEQVVIHAWNGAAWIPVSTEDYANGTFFARRPGHPMRDLVSLLVSRQQG